MSSQVVAQRTAKSGRKSARPLIYAAGMIPAVWTCYLGVVDQLGADPMKVLERSLGEWSLRFIIAAIAITPLMRLSGINLVVYRRPLGVLGFIYALLHLVVYVVLDQVLDLGEIWRDIVKRPYITIGMLAFLLMIPLAATSSDRMVRRLGAMKWRSLHRLVYIAAPAAALHYLLLVKAWPPEPIVYAALVMGLLLLRLMPRKRRRARVAASA